MIKFDNLKNITQNFKLAKTALLVCLVCCCVISLGSLLWAYSLTNKFQEKAFILTENGATAIATSINVNNLVQYREAEINNHIKTFHQLYWTLDQYNYEKKITEALNLIGQSGKDLYLFMKSEGYFSRIVSQNLIQTLTIDAIKINQDIYPFVITVEGEMLLKRTDQKITSNQSFNATMVLYNVDRTNENPHGLLIENYIAKTKPIKESRK
jgi:conjugative transposon TraK protein